MSGRYVLPSSGGYFVDGLWYPGAPPQPNHPDTQGQTFGLQMNVAAGTQANYPRDWAGGVNSAYHSSNYHMNVPTPNVSLQRFSRRLNPPPDRQDMRFHPQTQFTPGPNNPSTGFQYYWQNRPTPIPTTQNPPLPNVGNPPPSGRQTSHSITITDPSRQSPAATARDRLPMAQEKPGTDDKQIVAKGKTFELEPLHPPPPEKAHYRVTRKGLITRESYDYGNVIDVDEGISVQAVPYIGNIFFHNDKDGDFYVNIYANVLKVEIGHHFCAFLNTKGGIILLGATVDDGGRLVVQGCGAPTCSGPDAIQKGVDGLFKVDYISPHVFPHQYQMRVHKIAGGVANGQDVHLWLTEIIIKPSFKPDVVYKLDGNNNIFIRNLNGTTNVALTDMITRWTEIYKEKCQSEKFYINEQKKEAKNQCNLLKEETYQLQRRGEKVLGKITEKKKALEEEERKVNEAIGKMHSLSSAQKKEHDNIKADPYSGSSDTMKHTMVDEAKRQINLFEEFSKDVTQKGKLDSITALEALEKHYKLIQSKIENLLTEKELKRYTN